MEKNSNGSGNFSENYKDQKIKVVKKLSCAALKIQYSNSFKCRPILKQLY